MTNSKKRSQSSEPPEVVLRRRINTPPGAPIPTNYTNLKMTRDNSFNRRDSLRNQVALSCLSQQLMQRRYSLNANDFDGISTRSLNGYKSPIPELEIETKPKRSLIKNVFEAEASLWAMSMSIFFAMSGKFRRHFLLCNLCIVAPIFFTITTILSGWVVVFAIIGHFYYSNDQKSEQQRSQRSPNFLQQRSIRSSIASTDELLEEKDEQPIVITVNKRYPNNGIVSNTVPRIYSRLTAVQRQFINGHRQYELLARD